MATFTLFYRLILRPLAKERMRTALTVLAVSLGVAAVLAIELAGQAAAGSFRSSLETLTGRANLEVTSAGGIPPQVFARLATAPYPLKLHARMEDYGVIDGQVRRTVPIIGVDLLSEAGFETAGAAAAPRTFSQLSAGNSVWLTSGLGYKSGDRIRLLTNDTVSDFMVRGVVDNQAGEAIVMDLALATRVLRRGGRLDRNLYDIGR